MFAFFFFVWYNFSMKAMGIDFGLRRIGIAFSDETKFLASPFVVYQRKQENEDLNYLTNLVLDQKVDEIVCGLPLTTTGNEEDIAILTRAFMSKLEDKVHLKVIFVDERFSSVLAEEFLKERERDWRKRKQKLDAVSASIILQDYLDRRGK